MSATGETQLFDQTLLDACGVVASLSGLRTTALSAADLLGDALLNGHKLLACGNGGSAAAASHLTTELVVRFRSSRRAYPAISLSAHGGDLTAIGNDFCFEDCFARQVEAFGQAGDVLLALSTSGRSENIVRALRTARFRGVRSIVLLGGDGGMCLGLGDVELLVDNTVTARVQEAHQVLLHIICELVEGRLVGADKAGPLERTAVFG